MLQKLFGGSGRTIDGVLTSTADAAAGGEAVAAVGRLLSLYARLVRTEDGFVDTTSEAGNAACSEFLRCLSGTCEAMHLEPAARSYRVGFSINYRMLFPDESRSFRVDLLGASAGQCSTIWVNGDRYEFSARAVGLANGLQDAWARLCLFLDYQASSRQPASNTTVRELKPALEALDVAWANFECSYITELMEIEDRARELVVEAVECEQRLQALEDRPGAASFELGPAFVEERRNLVRCIARLNAVANFNRKGRDDLDSSAVEAAIATLQLCSASSPLSCSSDPAIEGLSVAACLAADVVDSFQAMRDYLSDLSSMISRVDPHLRNNAGLVTRLVDFEETWEMGSRYVSKAGVMNDVCGLIVEIRAVAREIPALAAMLESCDVELFLGLPRVVWLRHLAQLSSEPTSPSPSPMWSGVGDSTCSSRGGNSSRAFYGSGLIAEMLPHRQQDSDADDMDALLDKFERARRAILKAQKPGLAQSPSNLGGVSEFLVKLILIQRAICGSSEEMASVYANFLSGGPGRKATDEAVEDLMRDLEALSMELQRSCAEDWNQCVSVLVHQLADSSDQKKDRRPRFRV
eukprot:TRINITY_DN56283_c0_g1_i1.p1 TRINITY_DN56283_c0_g1~~TRINITY_DN56283_c0_g1_i1.p1  ORF type:complete len:579 (-),score=118.62 TRINITY_DN56283_c0_g1_i1:575-2311(-)